MDREKPDCWPAGKAEKVIRGYARSADIELVYTEHAREQMNERGIGVPDIINVLKNGYINDEARAGRKAGHCRYKICGATPNTGSREICVVAIPDPHKPLINIITAMWKDLS